VVAVERCDVGGTRFACYGRGDLDPEVVNLAAGDPVAQLAGLDELYQ